MTREWEPIKGETPIDPSDLKIKSIRTRSELSEYEAKNILKATVKYLAAPPSQRLAPFDYSWLLQVHREMFNDVWTWAGEPRTEDLTIGIPWGMIGQELGGLILNIAEFSTCEKELLDQAVTIHHKAVQIHPFKNGNGRWARMLANIWLRRNGKAAIEWPEAEVGKQASLIRKEYISAILSANDSDYRPLTELHRRFWDDR